MSFDEVFDVSDAESGVLSIKGFWARARQLLLAQGPTSVRVSVAS